MRLDGRWESGVWQVVEKRSEDVILSPFALRLRTALSEAKGLRVNSAKDLHFVESSTCEIPRSPSALLRAGSAAPRNDTGHEFFNKLLGKSALDFGSKAVQFFFDSFITAIDMVDAIDQGFTLGCEPGKHQRRACTQVRGLYLGAA